MTIRAAIKREERRLEKQLGSATSVEWNPFRCEGIGWVSKSRANRRKEASVVRCGRAKIAAAARRRLAKVRAKAKIGCWLAN
jgi:hypothetical protein